MRRATAIAVAGLLSAACSDTPVEAPLRALSSSGPVSFVCLDGPRDTADPGRPLEDCPANQFGTIDDFTVPHLYALVTQPNAADIAVVDLTTESKAVLDQDDTVPGANFLPVGSIPSDIVSTPGGMASFVVAREVQYEAIYALPSDMIRGSRARLTSWPACSLPAAPGEIELLLDPADADGAVRPFCDAAYGDSDAGACTRDGVTEMRPHCHGNLSIDALAAGKTGRYKLLVTLPSEGGFAIIDAQSVLDGNAGERLPCVIERWVPLEVAPPVLPPPPEPPVSDACVPVASPGDLTADNYSPLPAGVTVDDKLVYIADRGAPVIHRVDMPTPCEPDEIAPLVTSSVEDPLRPVFTTRVAVSPLTLDLQRFLYAIDDIDGSILVYDVSDASSTTLPLERPRAAQNPFQPSDRIRFGAPPRDIILLQHQNDSVDDRTGSTVPVRCDPDPDSDGPGVAYRTSSGYDSGAGPSNLRGVFAFAVLESGDIVVIDVDDYDAPCRGPVDQHPTIGCQEPLSSGLRTSGEYSCNAVAAHEPRSSGFLLHSDGIADNQPGVTQFPALFDADGALLRPDVEPSEDEDEPTERPPRMRATVSDAPSLGLVVGSTLEDLNPQTGLLRSGADADDLSRHTLAMNLVDPRTHILDQAWTVTYEGALPGFGGHFAELVETADGFELRDVAATFCGRGVRSQAAAEASFLAAGLDEPTAATRAERIADYVQIFSELPAEADPYWAGQNECSFIACGGSYGTVEAPLGGRDLRILEATDDRLILESRGSSGDAPGVKCCFPGVIEYRVRGGNQWIVVGGEVGFLTNMSVADDGTCRPSCDEDLALLTGRAESTPHDTVVSDGDPGAFVNPFFRFAINADVVRRNMQFELTTQGAFVPLTMSVVTNDSDVQPTAIQYLTTTGELVVSDGSLEGITFLDLNSLSVTRQHH